MSDSQISEHHSLVLFLEGQSKVSLSQQSVLQFPQHKEALQQERKINQHRPTVKSGSSHKVSLSDTWMARLVCSISPFANRLFKAAIKIDQPNHKSKR